MADRSSEFEKLVGLIESDSQLAERCHNKAAQLEAEASAAEARVRSTRIELRQLFAQAKGE